MVSLMALMYFDSLSKTSLMLSISEILFVKAPSPFALLIHLVCYLHDNIHWL